MVDLKRVYRASGKEAAESALDELDKAWGEKYPIVIKSWRTKWENLSVYFKYPEPIRRVICTTNSIEAVHRQFHPVTSNGLHCVGSQFDEPIGRCSFSLFKWFHYTKQSNPLLLSPM